jgi:hypothetical protein
MRFDLDAPGLEADKRMRDCTCKHIADATRRMGTTSSGLLHEESTKRARSR